MKKKNLQYFAMTSALFLMSGVFAQESSNSAGGDASGAGGSVAYSIGQVVYTTNTGSSGSVAQGVQHAYEIFSVGIHETELIISLYVYPNPTADNLTLEIKDFNNEKLAYQLTDIQGKLIFDGQVIEAQTILDMSGLAPATYFVDVLSLDNQRIQSFKIIKN
jgi:hypothetical protein